MLRGIMLGTHQDHSVPTATQSQGTRKPAVSAHMRTAECPLGTPCSHRNGKPTHKEASNQCMKAHAGCPPSPQYSHWNTRPRHQRSQPLAYICTRLDAHQARTVPTGTQGQGSEKPAITAALSVPPGARSRGVRKPAYSVHMCNAGRPPRS